MTLRMLPMSLRDLDEVCVLESSSHTSAWSKKNFEDSLEAGHWAFTLRRLREEGPDELLGYCLLMPGVEEIHLLNITVGPEYRRSGYAKKMMAVMEDAACSAGFPSMLLEVRASNQPAQGLYSSLGFTAIGLRKGYYPGLDGIREDAVVMQKNLGQ